jgi:pimeloyl-ACP methyl ester carboxylesterase
VAARSTERDKSADILGGLSGCGADGQLILVAASMGGSYATPYIVHEPSSVVGYVPIGAIGSEDYMQQLHAMPDRLAFPVRVRRPRRVQHLQCARDSTRGC